MYDLHFKEGNLSKLVPHITTSNLSKLYQKYAKNYPLVSIEDPFDQDDWDGWCELTAKLGTEGVQIVGDDLLVTNVRRIDEAIKKKACNALLLKVNQIGTLTESI